MKERILYSLMMRPDIQCTEMLLDDIIDDTISEVKGYLNYEDNEELPSNCKSIVQELVVIKLNRIGSEGLQSESLGGSNAVNQTFINGIPNEIKSRIRKFRRLPR